MKKTAEERRICGAHCANVGDGFPHFVQDVKGEICRYD